MRFGNLVVNTDQRLGELASQVAIGLLLDDHKIDDETHEEELGVGVR